MLCLPLERAAGLVPSPLQGANVTLALFHSRWHWVPLEGLQRVMARWDISTLSPQCGLAAPKASSLMLECVLQPKAMLAVRIIAAVSQAPILISSPAGTLGAPGAAWLEQLMCQCS